MPNIKYIEDLSVKKLFKEVYVIEQNNKKYLMDINSANIAVLPDEADISSEEFIEKISKMLPTEKKRVFTVDEFLIKNKITRMMIFLTSGCNMRCIYCHCNSSEGEAMSDELIYKALNKYLEHIEKRIEYVKQNEDTPQITFMGGGEPFLRINKIKEIVEYFNKKCTELGIGTKFVLVTNTTLGDDDDWRWLVENKFQINLSLDGPPHIQDNNRPLAKNLPSSHVVEKRLAFLSNLGAKCHVRSTVTSVENIKAICEYFKNYSCVVTHSLEPVSLAGRARNLSLNESNMDFYRDFFKEYSKFLYADPSRYKSAWFKPFKRTDGFCGAVYQNSIVTHDGYVSLCSEVDSSQKDNHLGEKFLVSHISNEGDPFTSEKALNFSKENKIENLKFCKDCIIKYKCGGGCYVKRERDFTGDDEAFYNTFCKQAILLNLNYLLGVFNNCGK